ASLLDRSAVAEHRFAQAVARQQPGGDARVLGGDGGHLAQDADGSGAQVFEIADRRGHDVELAQAPSSQAPTRSATWSAGLTQLRRSPGMSIPSQNVDVPRSSGRSASSNVFNS